MDPDAPERRRKSKQGEKKENDDNSENATIYKCRFCEMEYDKAQALGGHMNRHRQERENEELQKAKELVVFGREQRFGGPLYNKQGGSGPATLHQGGNIMIPNTPLMGATSRPYFPSNQQSLQNYQFNQLSQSSYSLQSQSQAPGGSFYDSQDSTRLQAQQLRVNPGQRQTAPRQQPGADFGSHSQGPFQMEPSPLDEVVLGSNRNTVTTPSFPPRGASQGNFQYPIVNPRLAPLNQTGHFQHTSPDQYLYVDQRPGSSAMGGLEVVIQLHGGLHMQPSFQDSTLHIQDDYQGGNDVVDAAGIEGSEPDGTDHIQDDHQDGNDVVDAAAGAGIRGSEPEGVSSDEKMPR